MKPTKYSQKVMDHFRNPRNVGTLEGEEIAVGRVGNPVCGDLMEMYIKVKDEKIDDIKFQTFGCGSAVATSSMITEMAKGKTLDEALKITRGEVADELEGLPPVKMHCSNLAADALHEAVKSYRAKQKQAAKPAEAPLKRELRSVPGEKEFLGRGVYSKLEELSSLQDKRILIVDRGAESLELAIKLTRYTGRVVYLTPLKELSASAELKNRLKSSDVKILYQAQLLEIMGEKEVEKVLVYDLNEDEDYPLFVDAVVVLPEIKQEKS